ncbi:hypothetical protein DDQ41_09190 [Streptomyces spongiicola]|uniref:Uncharacterized protein n=1 Tax=Streptomyces spongiicola TaxID=1690221 RepID=A0ABN5KL33_9ACTN|nr:hypothetical protein DDQ41_09190 [Streptomyces spongiicola]
MNGMREGAESPPGEVRRAAGPGPGAGGRRLPGAAGGRPGCGGRPGYGGRAGLRRCRPTRSPSPAWRSDGRAGPRGGRPSSGRGG